MIFVFNVDDTPFVGAGTDHFTINVESLLRPYDGKRDFVLVISI